MPDDEPDYNFLFAPRYLGSHYLNDAHKHVVFVYFAVASTDVVSDPKMIHERTEIRWVTKEELNGMGLRPNVLFYAKKALEELGEKIYEF